MPWSLLEAVCVCAFKVGEAVEGGRAGAEDLPVPQDDPCRADHPRAVGSQL